MIATNCNRMSCSYTWTEFLLQNELGIPLNEGLSSDFIAIPSHTERFASYKEVHGPWKPTDMPTHVHPVAFKSKITGVIVVCSYTMDHVIDQPPELSSKAGQANQPPLIHFRPVVSLNRANNPPKVTLEPERGVILVGTKRRVYRPARENIFSSQGFQSEARGCSPFHGFRKLEFFSFFNPLMRNRIA